MSIYFHTVSSVDDPTQGEKNKYKSWLKSIAAESGFSIKNINYIFCDDDYLIEINRMYLNHDDYTDIITFPYTVDSTGLESDIYISVQRVKENAALYHVDFTTEILRVMAHGLLHLLGYSDKTEVEKTEMRRKEDECIEIFSSS